MFEDHHRAFLYLAQKLEEHLGKTLQFVQTAYKFSLSCPASLKPAGEEEAGG